MAMQTSASHWPLPQTFLQDPSEDGGGAGTGAICRVRVQQPAPTRSKAATTSVKGVLESDIRSVDLYADVIIDEEGVRNVIDLLVPGGAAELHGDGFARHPAQESAARHRIDLGVGLDLEHPLAGPIGDVAADRYRGEQFVADADDRREIRVPGEICF